MVGTDKTQWAFFGRGIEKSAASASDSLQPEKFAQEKKRLRVHDTLVMP